MTTSYTMTVACDERRSPGCLGEHTVTADSCFAFDRVTVLLQTQGWWRGYREGQTFDLCPACWEQAYPTPRQAGPPVPTVPSVAPGSPEDARSGPSPGEGA